MSENDKKPICDHCLLPHRDGCEKGRWEHEGHSYQCGNFKRRVDIMALGWVEKLFPRGRRFDQSQIGRAPVEIPSLAQAQRSVLDHLQRGQVDDWRWENIVLCGPNGTGKTDLAMAAVNWARSQGWTAVFVSVPDLINAIKAAFEDSAEHSEDEIIDALQRIDLLVLDDFGKERGTEFAEELLYRLIDYRHREMIPTIYTTNLGPEDFASTDRKLAIARRLQEGALCIVMAENVREASKAA